MKYFRWLGAFLLFFLFGVLVWAMGDLVTDLLTGDDDDAPPRPRMPDAVLMQLKRCDVCHEASWGPVIGWECAHPHMSQAVEVQP